MSSLRQLRAEHGSLLLIDAASSRVQVGWLSAAGDRWEISETEAGIGIFAGIEKLACDLAQIRAFIFCDGPGSILGIRTAAMAIRAWNVLSPRPVYSYQSLELLAHALNDPRVTVIADARRETWHAFRLGGKMQRVPTAELAGELVTPDAFRHWSTLPENVTRHPYAVRELLEQTADQDLLRASTAPDAFLHEEPNYVTWSPQIHRAP